MVVKRTPDHPQMYLPLMCFTYSLKRVQKYHYPANHRCRKWPLYRYSTEPQCLPPWSCRHACKSMCSCTCFGLAVVYNRLQTYNNHRLGATEDNNGTKWQLSASNTKLLQKNIITFVLHFLELTVPTSVLTHIQITAVSFVPGLMPLVFTALTWHATVSILYNEQSA